MTVEIPQRHWAKFCEILSAKFCEKLSATGRGLIDIRVESSDDMRLVAQGVPLRSLDYEVGDACNSSLIIEFGSPHGGLRQHCVVEPIRFILRKESQSDHYDLLEFPSESGMTAISLHPGISPALLSELGLSECSPALTKAA